MRVLDPDQEKAVRERAYRLWESEGRPAGRAHAHWERALAEVLPEEPSDGLAADQEAIVEGRPTADYPAVLTRDSRGG